MESTTQLEKLTFGCWKFDMTFQHYSISKFLFSYFVFIYHFLCFSASNCTFFSFYRKILNFHQYQTNQTLPNSQQHYINQDKAPIHTVYITVINHKVFCFFLQKQDRKSFPKSAQVYTNTWHFNPNHSVCQQQIFCIKQTKSTSISYCISD